MSDNTNDKRTIDILCNNLNGLLNEEGLSMRQLSLDIGASSSYIQKVMTCQSSPALDKIEKIGDRFDLDTWALFCDFDDAAQDSLAILQMNNRLSESKRAEAREHMKFLLKQYEEYNARPQDPTGNGKTGKTSSGKKKN